MNLRRPLSVNQTRLITGLAGIMAVLVLLFAGAPING
jgi:hypothetical protein